MGQKNAVSSASSTAVLERELQSIQETSPCDNRVLLVDDEETLIDALAEFLRMRGFEVETAMNPRQALALIHERSFSVVVSDLRMPGMNGVELLEQVLDVDPETVVIIMTGFASVQSAVDALKKGAYDYVMKPFSVHDFEKTLRLGLERRKLERQNLQLSHLMRKMVEVDQIKSDIISTVSHEFRTPLMSLKGYLMMLAKSSEQNLQPGDVEKTWLHAMKDNLGRLEMLILNLLLMTEANSGDLFIADEDTDVSELAADVISRCGTLAKGKGVDISLKVETKSGIRGDIEKLRVALNNLVENAIKFNFEAGTVEVAVGETSAPEGVSISVKDSGIGIPEEKLANMFDCFTQVDMTKTRRFNGAGLGLPVAKAIVEAHGGHLDAESKPGRGSTFRMWLPRVYGV